MKYNLEHLTQSLNQEVLGPIQDDEALLLYSIVRVMRLHNILEIGGLSGYSAKNFIAAIIDGFMYTVDINPVSKLAENHIPVIKDCRLINKNDVYHKIDMIFFDAHVYEEQLACYETLKKNEIINEDEIVLAFHDTNLHPSKVCNSYYLESEGGWCHQPVERSLVQHFKTKGFDAICFHTKLDEKTIKYRHGLTIMRKFKNLNN